MSYSVVGLPPLNPSNGCPRQPIPRKGGSLINRDTQLKIQVEEQETAAEPVLRTPPRPRADGQVGGETPPPQKSFVQKYWFCECAAISSHKVIVFSTLLTTLFQRCFAAQTSFPSSSS